MRSRQQPFDQIARVLLRVGLAVVVCSSAWIYLRTPISEWREANREAQRQRRSERAAAQQREREQLVAETRQRERIASRQISKSRPRVVVKLDPGETYRFSLAQGAHWWGWDNVSSCVDVVINGRYRLEDCPDDEEIYLDAYLAGERFRWADFTARSDSASMDFWTDFDTYKITLTEESPTRTIIVRPGEYVEVNAYRAVRLGTKKASAVSAKAREQCVGVEISGPGGSAEVCPGRTFKTTKRFERLWLRAIKHTVTVDVEAIW